MVVFLLPYLIWPVLVVIVVITAPDPCMLPPRTPPAAGLNSNRRCPRVSHKKKKKKQKDSKGAVLRTLIMQFFLNFTSHNLSPQ